MLGDLSENFSKREFVCPDGCGFDTPDAELVVALQQLRAMVDAPILITSGCRCRVHNERVGGAPNSQHLLGKAADIVVEGMLPVFLAVEAGGVTSFRFGGIGIYPKKGHVHLDVRGERARWIGD